MGPGVRPKHEEIDVAIERVLISQYGATLRMLRSTVEACPETLWTDAGFRNRFWHVAYHTLRYTHLYLAPSVEAFVPWEKGRPETHYLGPMPDPPHAEPKIGDPYSRSEILEYGERIAAMVAPRVRALPLDGPSGFPWLPFTRLELHLYNIRHVQHHTGQLAGRIRDRCGVGIDWVGMDKEAGSAEAL
jgi:hypothetical protein